MHVINTQQLLKHIRKGGVLVDIRETKEFTSGFLSGSIFLSPDEHFAERMTAFVPAKSTVVFVSGSQTDFAIPEKIESTFEVAGTIPFNKEAFVKEGLTTDMIIEIDPDEFAMDLRFDDRALAIDLRDAEQYVQAHVKQALSLPFMELSDVAQIAGLDEEGYIYFYADEESKAVTAGSLLKKHGLHDLRLVAGGWDAIQREDSIQIDIPKAEKKK